MNRSTPQQHSALVFKFGGTSLATAARIRHVVALVLAETRASQRVVVASALGGVTDDLLHAIDAALARTGTHGDVLETLRQRHTEVLNELSAGKAEATVEAQLAQRWEDLSELLDGVYLLRECTGRTRDAIIGMGERMSAPLVAAAFRAAGTDAIALDATNFIRTDDRFGEATVLLDETERLIQEHITGLPEDQIAVVTGFIGATERGVVTTLGRSGSDYTATLLGAALQAEQVVIWTDVDGVLSADPHMVIDAFPIPRLSYREAAEMAYFGAKVLHPRTMLPVEERGIPIVIKNTLNPDAPGTLISTETDAVDLRVKAVSTVRYVAVVMVEGAGLLGMPGMAARVFDALADRQINVLMISQASSEQSICLVVNMHDADAAVTTLEVAFEYERARGDVRTIYALTDCAVISAVGDKMRHVPGLAGRMFATLGRAGVNVLAIAQGAAETNISAVVHENEVRPAVVALHEAFPMRRTRAHVCVIGTGVVGAQLLEMMQDHTPGLLADHRLNLRLIGLTNSRLMVWNEDGLPLANIQKHLDEQGEPADLNVLIDNLLTSRLERLMVVDATASVEVARRYPELLEHGIGVVTPNKRANTLDMAFYRRLREAAQQREVSYHYETTVMAGLPVLFTLRDLLRSGDRIEQIEGVFSGTLAFLFNRLAEGQAFSDVIYEARERGLTEPDPRDDLQGEDVARKLLILAREIGLEVERADVAVESLVPFHLSEISVADFMDRISEMDANWQARVASATEQGQRLYYVGLIQDGRLRVGVRAVDPGSPFGCLQSTDNTIMIRSARYHETPLVVQGPGAGPAVTAAGLLADLVKAAELMP